MSFHSLLYDGEITHVYKLLFHCSDTVSRSVVFCAITTTIERCKAEGVVDVFQVVKAMRNQKPGAVCTVVSRLAVCLLSRSL